MSRLAHLSWRLAFATCLAAALSASRPGLSTNQVLLRFVDAQTQRSTACRLSVRGPGGWLFAEADTLLKPHRGLDGVPFVQVEDSLRLELVGGLYEIRAVRGIHGVPWVTEQQVDGDLELTLLLDRWIDPHVWGWIGADPHVHHVHDAPDRPYPALTPAELGRIARAEVLDVMFVLANDPLRPGGPVTPPQPGVCLEWGEEYRNHFWGHTVLLGLTELVLTRGSPGCCTPYTTAWPTLEEQLRQASFSVGLIAHPHTTDDVRPSDYWPGTGFARERAALALGDRVQGMAVASGSNGPTAWALDDYLDALRAGARWAAAGETDRYLADYPVGPAGLLRTYARIQSGVPSDAQAYGEAWREAVRQRRTFATTGPFLRYFLVDGEMVGATVSREGPGAVAVGIGLSSQEPVERLTIHGATGIHWEHAWAGGRTSLDTTLVVALTTDDFLVIEAEAAPGAWHLAPDGPRLVSSPIWVDMGNPWAVPKDVARRGADGLAYFWWRSLLDRGYEGPEDSLATRDYVLGGAAAYEAMHDDEPGPFWPVWPPEGWESPSTGVTFRWTASPSLDGEPSLYELFLSQSADFDPVLQSTTTADTSAQLENLKRGRTYYWRVQVSEPGEAPRPQEESARHLTVAAHPVGVPSQRGEAPPIQLSPARPVPGGVALDLEIARAGPVGWIWFDVRGRCVGREEPRWRAAGTHRVRWDGRDLRGAPVASGVYWIVVRASGHRAVQRVLLLSR